MPVRVVSSEGPEALKVKEPKQLTGVAAVVVLAIFLAVFAGFGVMCFMHPFAWIFFGGFGILSGLWWVITKWLPKWKLGHVEYRFDQKRLSPGDTLTGILSIRPRGNLSLNQIAVTISAREECISGSGSSRTTHRHTLFELTDQLSTADRIMAGSSAKYPIRFAVPSDAAASIELNDNKLIWSVKAHVDIPRWPDWREEVTFQVVPNKGAEIVAGDPSISPTPSAGTGAGIGFGETVQMIWAARDQPEQVERLVAAVKGLSMEMECLIVRRLLTGASHEMHAYPGGAIVQARYRDPELALTLYVPFEREEEFHELSGRSWRGRGTIVGFDLEAEALQIKTVEG